MSGNNFVLDSNVIIYASNCLVDAENLVNEDSRYYISIISFIEVYAFDFVNLDEKKVIDDILRNVEIVEINREIADQAIIYRKNRTKKIKLPDAVILATAGLVNGVHITNNRRDFEGIDPTVSINDIGEFKNTDQ